MMGCCQNFPSTKARLFFFCVLSVVLVTAVECDQVEKRDVHRIILKGARRPRSSHKSHRHYHHHHGSSKSHGHAPTLRDHSYENLDAYDSQSGESIHEHRGRGRQRAPHTPNKHHRDSREKYRDRSSERNLAEHVGSLQDYKGYKDYNDYRSHENSFEDFNKGRKPFKRNPLQMYKKPSRPISIPGTRFAHLEPFDSKSSEKQHHRFQRHRHSGEKYRKQSNELEFDNDSNIFPKHSSFLNSQDYLAFNRSHGHSSEEYHTARPHKFLLTSKKPHYVRHSAEYDESRQEPHSEWKPVHYNEPKPTFHPLQTTHKSKRHRSKKTKPFKGSIELTTAYPQKIPFVLYDNTEYPYVESTFHGFNSKTIDLVNAPALNLETIKTLTQQKTLPTQRGRPSYEVNENTKHDLHQNQQHNGYQILVPDVTRSQFQASESQLHEHKVKPETTTVKVTTTRRQYNRGQGKFRTRKQNLSPET